MDKQAIWIGLNPPSSKKKKIRKSKQNICKYQKENVKKKSRLIRSNCRFETHRGRRGFKYPTSLSWFLLAVAEWSIRYIDHGIWKILVFYNEMALKKSSWIEKRLHETQADILHRIIPLWMSFLKKAVVSNGRY